jgi:uncharacterized membrane protein
MSNLFVITFSNESGAGNMLNALKEWQSQNLIQIDDVAIAVRGPDNKIRIKYADQLVGKKAGGGGFLHSFFGAIYHNPVVGGEGTPMQEYIAPMVGEDADSAINTLKGDQRAKKYAQRKNKNPNEVCIDPTFVREISESFKLGMSAIFIYTEKADTDKIIPQLKKFKGTLIKTSLTFKEAQALQEAFGVEEIKSKDPLDIIGNVR